MKKFLLSILIVGIFFGVSSADIIYTTTAGNMGLIPIISSRDVSAPLVQYSGMGKNALAAPFWDGEKSCVILIDRAEDMTTSSGDAALIFSGKNLTKPTHDRKTLTGIYDTRGVSYSLNGRSIFLASYLNGTIAEIDTETLEPVHMYVHENTGSDDIYTPHAVGVRTDYYYVYGLINSTPEKSEFMRFDGQLKRDVEIFLSYNINSEVYSLAEVGNNSYAFPCPDGIRILSNKSINMLMSSDYPVKSVCPDSSNGFYFVTQKISGDVSFDVLAHYSDTVSTLQEIEAASACSVVRGSYNVLAAIVGGKIFMYNMNDDTLLAEFDSEALGGGEPVSAAENGSSGLGSNTSNSNCDISGAGIILLSACVCVIFRRKE